MSDSEEAAVAALRDIYAAFGLGEVVSPESSSLLPLIDSGALVFDPNKETCEYRLRSPLELKNGERFEVVSFREASGSELEYIRRGVYIKSDQSISIGDLTSMALRVLVKVGGVETGLVNRIKARDVDTLRDIFAELGFFLR